MTEIRFHLKNEPHGYLSNFYELPQPIQIDGLEWATSEHYFQAQQFIPRLRNSSRPSVGPDPKACHIAVVGCCCCSWVYGEGGATVASAFSFVSQEQATAN